MFGFRKRNVEEYLHVDIHSHLIPGIDDGSKSMDQTITLLRSLADCGIKKVVTTPHIAQEFYPNTPEIIRRGLENVKERLANEEIPILLEAAAEYYMDQHFLHQLKDGAELLTFGDGFLLFETPFFNKPPFFDEVVFELLSKGLKPVFAHPERYEYIIGNPEMLFSLREKNVLLQVNVGSLAGYYSPLIKKTANWMVKHGLIDFLGSDIHHERHLAAFVKFRKTKAYQKLLTLKLLNDSLL